MNEQAAEQQAEVKMYRSTVDRYKDSLKLKAQMMEKYQLEQ